MDLSSLEAVAISAEASADSTVVVGSMAVVIDTAAADRVAWVATEADTACLVVEGVAIAVAVVVADTSAVTFSSLF